MVIDNLFFRTQFNINMFGNMYGYEQELSSYVIYIYSRAEITEKKHT
jgi:hypothetical protein